MIYRPYSRHRQAREAARQKIQKDGFKSNEITGGMGFASNDAKLIIDCRKIPIIYGPDETSNHLHAALSSCHARLDKSSC